MKKKPEENQEQICFTIMPFGGWFDTYYKEIYCPAIKKAGLTPYRANDIYRPSAIVPDIWELTKKAKLILADLSGRNPNVFYELGLAHAIARPAILITESLEDVPFDLRALRIIEYDKNVPDWGTELRTNIEQYIKEVLLKPNESVPVNFLKKDNDEKTKIALIQEERLLAAQNEINLLRRTMEMNNSRIRHIQEISHPTSRSEAVARIREYLSLKMPERMIIERLTQQGVSRVFVEREIDRLRNKFLFDLNP